MSKRCECGCGQAVGRNKRFASIDCARGLTFPRKEAWDWESTPEPTPVCLSSRPGAEMYRDEEYEQMKADEAGSGDPRLIRAQQAALNARLVELADGAT